MKKKIILTITLLIIAFLALQTPLKNLNAKLAEIDKKSWTNANYQF